MGLSSLFPPVLVITARLRNLLAPWYSRWHAQHYESKRQGKRWQSETKAFRLLYRQVDPQRVLDCPVGTGRWFEEYQEHGASVLGIDLSKDMLAEAAKKIRPGAKIALKQADVLAAARLDLGSGYDLIVCTRFVHWLRLPDVKALIAGFASTGSRFLLLGARVKADAPGPARAARRSWSARLRHALTFSHVHDEKELLEILTEQGWKLIERARIGRGGSWIYFFYLLRRSQP